MNLEKIKREKSSSLNTQYKTVRFLATKISLRVSFSSSFASRRREIVYSQPKAWNSRFQLYFYWRLSFMRPSLIRESRSIKNAALLWVACMQVQQLFKKWIRNLILATISINTLAELLWKNNTRQTRNQRSIHSRWWAISWLNTCWRCSLNLQTEVKYIFINWPRISSRVASMLVKSKNIFNINFKRKIIFQDRVNERGKEPIINLIKATGQWPMLEGKNWDETQFDVKKTILNFRKYISKSDEDIFASGTETNEVRAVRQN